MGGGAGVEGDEDGGVVGREDEESTDSVGNSAVDEVDGGDAGREGSERGGGESISIEGGRNLWVLFMTRNYLKTLQNLIKKLY